MGRNLLIAAIATLAVTGCGRLSFVGSRFDNFSAYYNTYYNAEKALEEGVRALDEQMTRQVVDQDVFLPLFGGSGRAMSQRQPFEDAIQKGADILRKHPNSKWVDDAMMVIGEAWFHTRNYVGAGQKFQEVLTLESPLHDRARFWLARTYIVSGEFEAAYDHLQATLSREDIDRRWEPQLRLALAELHVQRENWEEAARELEAGLAGARDQQLAARARFLQGQVYEVLGRYGEAVEAYAAVGEFKPPYELSYAAQYSAVRVQGEQVDAAEAMRALRRMERDDKNYEHRAELAYLRGRILQEMGFYDESLTIFDELLYDPTANGATVRGPTHYSLGTFYRDIILDFPFAAAHFDTAQRSLGSGAQATLVGSAGSSLPPQYAPGAITDGDEQARIFLNYTEVLDRISHMDSLLYLGSLDDSTFEAAILALRQRMKEEQLEQQRLMERRQAESQFRGRGAGGMDDGFGGRTPQGKDVGQGGSADAGFLYHRDVVRMQEAYSDFVLIWGERPLAPNWRRIDAVTALADTGELEEFEIAQAFTQLGDDLPPLDVSDVPRDSAGQRIMRSERAIARYELANVLFLSMNMPDSAAAWYRLVLEESSDEPVAQRAYFALAEMQLSLGDTLAAQTLYREIMERDARSELARQAAERLGLEVAAAVPTDSLTRAEAAYATATGAWQQGVLDAALDSMVSVAADYHTTPVAPRALLAAGRVYLEWAARDSLDVFAALPLHLDPAVLSQQRLRPAQASDSTDADSLNLPFLYRKLVELYPGAPERQHADRMLAALSEHWVLLHPPVDTAAVDTVAGGLAAADTLATGAAADTLTAQAAAGQPGTTAGAALPPVAAFGAALAEARPEDPDPSPEETPGEAREAGLGLIDWYAGGYTLVVRTERSHEAALGFARNFGRSFGEFPQPIDVFTAVEEGELVYRIGIGLFETRQEVEALLEEFSGFLPPGSRIVRLPPRQEAKH